MSSKSISNLIGKLEKFHLLVKSEDINFLSSIEAKVQDLLRKITKCEVIIPLLGEFSSGKSSLVNSLIGQKVLPVDVTPTTFLVNEISFSADSDRIEIEYYDGSVERLENLVDLNKINYHNAKMVKVFVKRNILPRNIILVDIPGLSSVIARHDEIISDYLPKSDAIFLVTDINQGTLTKTVMSFLELSKSLEKKIYLILTKSDTKTDIEISEIREFYLKNFPFFDLVITTSAKQNNVDEFLQLVKKVNEISGDLIFQSVSKSLIELCNLTSKILKEHIENSKLNLNELESKIEETEKAMKLIEEELRKNLDKLNKGIDNAKVKATLEFHKTLESQRNSLTDLFFSSKDEFQKEFENTVQKALEKSARIFEREVKIQISDFKNELELMRINVQVPSTVQNILTGISEVVAVVILNLLLPGGIIYALIGRIVLSIIEKIPKIGKLAGVLQLLINQIISEIGKLVAKSYISGKIQNAFIRATEIFDQEISQQSDLLYREIKVEMEREFAAAMRSYKDSIQRLLTEKQENEKNFAEYINRIKNLNIEIEKICI